MPKLLKARPPKDGVEECTVRRLATSRHAPADWIARARMITGSWDGARTTQIAAELRCHPQRDCCVRRDRVNAARLLA